MPLTLVVRDSLASPHCRAAFEYLYTPPRRPLQPPHAAPPTTVYAGDKGEKKRKAWAAVPTWIVALCKGQTITETHTANAALPSVMDYTQLEDYAAVCCAIQNLTLSMHTAGVSAKWSTGGVTRKDSFRQLIGAAPDEMVVGVLMCGYRRASAPALRPPMKRRPLLAPTAEEESSCSPVLCFRP